MSCAWSCFVTFTLHGIFCCSSGISEPQLTDIEKLLAEIDSLEVTGSDVKVSKIYGRNDKSDAESIRDAALLEVQSSDSDIDDGTVSSAPLLSHENNQTDSHNSNLNDGTSEPASSDDVTMSLVASNSEEVDLTLLDNFEEDYAVIEVPIEIIDPANAQGRNVCNSANVNTSVPQKKTTISSASCSKSQADRAIESSASVQFFFNDSDDLENQNLEDQSEKMITKHSGRKSNPKQDLVQYLEKKSDVSCIVLPLQHIQHLTKILFELQKELDLRKDELQFRKDEFKKKEKREAGNLKRDLDIRKDELECRRAELKLREKEMEIRQKETENKSKELEILHEKTKGDIANQKAMADVLIALANRIK